MSENLEMDADGMTAMINGEEIPVTTREFNILYKLLSYPKKTLQGHSLWMSSGGLIRERACGLWMSM